MKKALLLQKCRNGAAAKRFFRKLLKGQQALPNQLVTDKLGSYRVAHRELMSMVAHDTSQYSNNRCEASHRATREKERQMKRFRRAATAEKANKPAEAQQHAEDALANARAALEAYARVARDQSDRGAIATLNEYVYRPLREKLKELRSRTSE